MLRNLSILHSEKIIVRGGRLGTCFDQSEHEVAFRYIAARHEDRRAAGLRDLRNPRFHARDPITHSGGMLGVMITVDEFIEAIKTQFDRQPRKPVPRRGRDNEHRACDANVLKGAFAGMSGAYFVLSLNRESRPDLSFRRALAFVV